MLYHARFDILIKYICLKDFVANGRKWSNFTKQLYKQHLGIMTSETFREKESSKSGLEGYLNVFESLEVAFHASDRLANGIPSDKHGHPLDGAHRIACAMLHNRSVSLTEDADAQSPNYGFDWFWENNFSFNGYVINRLLDEQPALRLAIVWPSTEMQSNIVHRLPSKYLVANIKSAGEIPHNTVVNAYLGESWLGNSSNGFSGAYDKVDLCFRTPNPTQIVLFDSTGHDVSSLKEKLRLIAGVGKHSIHITDTAAETREKANIFLCSDYQEWASFTKLNSSTHHSRRIAKLKKDLSEVGLEKSDFVLTKGGSMEVFSLRTATDMDVVSFKHSDQSISKFIEVEYLDETHIRQGYFEYQGVYCWSYNRLLKDRLQKGDEKSKEDLRLMRGDLKRSVPFRMLRQFHRQKQFMRRTILNIFVDLGVYEVLRKIYRKIK